jgi:LCP family protein required for cell wall assembly
VTEVVPTAATGTEETVAEDGTFVLYISGIDSRVGLVSKSRSDVNILAVVNANTHQVLLVSTPRDYYVPLSISNGVRDKLTHAGIYGVEVSMATLGMLYDINVDYYFRVNFGGFEDIVDALGGVTVYSEYSFTTYDGNYSFSAGDNTLNGAQALGFARERKAFITGDRQRGINQMALIKAIANKVLSPSILANYSSLLESVQGNFETSVPMSVLSKLVRDQLSNGGSWNIVSYSVDGTGDNQIPYSLSTYSYVMWPDEDTVATAKDLMSQVLNGETVTAP